MYRQNLAEFISWVPNHAAMFCSRSSTKSVYNSAEEIGVDGSLPRKWHSWLCTESPPLQNPDSVLSPAAGTQCRHRGCPGGPEATWITAHLGWWCIRYSNGSLSQHVINKEPYSSYKHGILQLTGPISLPVGDVWTQAWRRELVGSQLSSLGKAHHVPLVVTCSQPSQFWEELPLAPRIPVHPGPAATTEPCFCFSLPLAFSPERSTPAPPLAEPSPVLSTAP